MFRQGRIDKCQIFIMEGDEPSRKDVYVGQMESDTMAEAVVESLNAHPIHGRRGMYFTRTPEDHDTMGN